MQIPLLECSGVSCPCPQAPECESWEMREGSTAARENPSQIQQVGLAPGRLITMRRGFLFGEKHAFELPLNSQSFGSQAHDVAYWHFSEWCRAARCPFIGCRLTGRRNTGVKSLCWGFKLQGLTWSFVELTSHFVQMGLRMHRQVGAMRKVLSQQAIGVLVRSALPRALWIAKIASMLVANVNRR
jgi:hypothetical protein